MNERKPLTEEFVRTNIVSVDGEVVTDELMASVMSIVRWTESQHGIFELPSQPQIEGEK